MPEPYNALAHYAGMRAACVADLPEDINLEALKLTREEQALLHKGIPEVREAILSVYRSVGEHAREHFLTPQMLKTLGEKGGFMSSNHTARITLDTVFHTLFSILADGEQSGTDLLVTKVYLSALQWPERQKLKYRHELTRHFEYFCRIECLQNGRPADYRKCDTVVFSFDSDALLFTLRYLARTGRRPLYFQYGDLRCFSASGRREDADRFPKSVWRKVIGTDFRYYGILREMFRATFGALPGGENPYQGAGFFQLIEEYDTGLINTRTEITARKETLILGVRMGFEEFGRLPEIFGSLSESVKKGFLETHQCADCALQCHTKRQAVFDEAVYPQRILKPCKCFVSELVIRSDEDIQSAGILFEHMKRYGIPAKKRAGAVK